MEILDSARYASDLVWIWANRWSGIYRKLQRDLLMDVLNPIDMGI
jgi:hypothetical protein